MFTAGGMLLQRLEHLNDAIGWFRAISAALGLNQPLKSAWEVLPFSFVVDWFSDVSTHLARLATLQPAEEWDVYDVSSSYQIDVAWNVEQVHRSGWDVGSQSYFLGRLSGRRYKRYVGLPIDLRVYLPSIPSPEQLSLLLAMGVDARA
jgi:hypothetical protein